MTGDRYAGEWPRERFQAHGITYQPAEMNRSELYLAFLPLLNSARVDLLDNPRMVAQFVGLERRTAVREGIRSIMRRALTMTSPMRLRACSRSRPMPR